MLDKKPLTQITVKDIVEECGINRNSFYYHFQDIPSLIDELLTEETERLIVDYSPAEPIEICLINAMCTADKNRNAILHVYRYIDRSIFEEYLWRICDRIVAAFTKNELQKYDGNEKELEIFKHLFRCECFGFLVEWLNGTISGSCEDEITRFCMITRRLLAGQKYND